MMKNIKLNNDDILLIVLALKFTSKNTINGMYDNDIDTLMDELKTQSENK